MGHGWIFPEVKKLVADLETNVASKTAYTLSDKSLTELERLLEALDYVQLLNVVPILHNSQAFPRFRSQHMVAERQQQISGLVFKLATLQEGLGKWVLPKYGGVLPLRLLSLVSLLYKKSATDTKARRLEPLSLKATMTTLEKMLEYPLKDSNTGLDVSATLTAAEVFTIYQMLTFWKGICVEPAINLSETELGPYHILAAFSIFEELYEAEAAKQLSEGKVLSQSVPPKLTATTQAQSIISTTQATSASKKILDDFRKDLLRFLPSMENLVWNRWSDNQKYLWICSSIVTASTNAQVDWKLTKGKLDTAIENRKSDARKNEVLFRIKDDDINTLQETVRKRNETINSKNVTIRQHDATIAVQLQNILGNDASLFAQQETNIKMINSTHNQVQELTRSLEAKHQDLQKSRDEVEKVRKEGEDRLQKLRAENEGYRKKENEQAQHSTALELDLTATQANLDTANNEIEKLQGTWKINKEKYDSMKKDHAEKTLEVLTLRSNNEAENDRIEVAVRIANGENARMQIVLETRDEAIISLHIIIAEKNQKLDAAEKEISELHYSRQLDQHLIAALNESKTSIRPSSQNNSKSQVPDT